MAAPKKIKKEKLQFVLLGGTGRIATKIVFPALYKIFRLNLLPEDFYLVGVSRRELDDSSYRKMVKDALISGGDLQINDQDWDQFETHIKYIEGDLNSEATFDSIHYNLSKIDQDLDKSAKLFYSCVSDEVEQAMFEGIANSKLSKICRERESKFILQEPFGVDLKSAEVKQFSISRFFSEHKIYRIDPQSNHRVLQDLKSLLKENIILSSLLDYDSIDQIRITDFSSSGAQFRGEFYDQVGLVREKFYGPITSMLTTFLDIEIEELLKFLQLKGQVTLGQYIQGLTDGRLVRAFTAEDSVNDQSETPTYLATNATYVTDKKELPVFIRTGMRLKQDFQEIAIYYKKAGSAPQNKIMIRLKPELSILGLVAIKKQGLLKDYSEILIKESAPIQNQSPQLTHFESALYSIINGERELFPRFKEIQSRWRIAQMVHKEISKTEYQLHSYPSGVWDLEQNEMLLQGMGKGNDTQRYH